MMKLSPIASISIVLCISWYSNVTQATRKGVGRPVVGRRVASAGKKRRPVLHRHKRKKARKRKAVVKRHKGLRKKRKIGKRRHKRVSHVAATATSSALKRKKLRAGGAHKVTPKTSSTVSNSNNQSTTTLPTASLVLPGLPVNSSRREYLKYACEKLDVERAAYVPPALVQSALETVNSPLVQLLAWVSSHSIPSIAIPIGTMPTYSASLPDEKIMTLGGIPCVIADEEKYDALPQYVKIVDAYKTAAHIKLQHDTKQLYTQLGTGITLRHVLPPVTNRVINPAIFASSAWLRPKITSVIGAITPSCIAHKGSWPLSTISTVVSEKTASFVARNGGWTLYALNAFIREKLPERPTISGCTRFVATIVASGLISYTANEVFSRLTGYTSPEDQQRKAWRLAIEQLEQLPQGKELIKQYEQYETWCSEQAGA